MNIFAQVGGKRKIGLFLSPSQIILRLSTITVIDVRKLKLHRGIACVNSQGSEYGAENHSEEIIPGKDGKG